MDDGKHANYYDHIAHNIASDTNFKAGRMDFDDPIDRNLLGLKDWTYPVWTVAVVTLLLALIPLNYEEISVIFPQKIAGPYFFPFLMGGGPLMLYMLALIRHKRMKLR